MLYKQKFIQRLPLSAKKHSLKPIVALALSVFIIFQTSCKSQRSSRPSYGMTTNIQEFTAFIDTNEAINSRQSIIAPSKYLFLPRTASPTLAALAPQKVSNCYLSGNLNPTDLEDTFRDSLVSVARQYLGTRYRSAGKTPRGFDCSGFTGYVFGQFGIKLPSCSATQARIGERISINEARKGDLVFFGYQKKRRKHRWTRVSHAGIVISEPGEPLRIIHSASRKGVIISTVNHSRYWKRRLLFTRSVINEKVSEKVLNS